MKLSFATVALALALSATRSAAQGSPSDFAKGVPACAQDCVGEATAASPCAANLTFDCICANQAALGTATLACLQKKGNPCDQQALNQLAQLGASVCPTNPAPKAPTVSATPSQSANATAVVTQTPPPATFTGGAAQIAVTYGGAVLMAAVALVV